MDRYFVWTLHKLAAGHERLRDERRGVLHFHTKNQASLLTCELSYCCVIVYWQESWGNVVM